jgi:hypothetical protein
MRLKIALLLALLMAAGSPARASTLPPEFKAYDFAQAYYIEDGGVVIVPYDHGFSCQDGIETLEGIRIMPGGTFRQFDGSRLIVDEYKLLYLNETGRRAWFREHSYRYKVVKDEHGKYRDVIGQEIATNEFYLSKFRGLEWFDFAFPDIEIHPGAQGWRTRPRY